MGPWVVAIGIEVLTVCLILAFTMGTDNGRGPRK